VGGLCNPEADLPRSHRRRVLLDHRSPAVGPGPSWAVGRSPAGRRPLVEEGRPLADRPSEHPLVEDRRRPWVRLRPPGAAELLKQGNVGSRAKDSWKRW
jgi:hypothetical protein